MRFRLRFQTPRKPLRRPVCPPHSEECAGFCKKGGVFRGDYSCILLDGKCQIGSKKNTVMTGTSEHQCVGDCPAATTTWEEVTQRRQAAQEKAEKARAEKARAAEADFHAFPPLPEGASSVPEAARKVIVEVRCAAFVWKALFLHVVVSGMPGRSSSRCTNVWCAWWQIAKKLTDKCLVPEYELWRKAGWSL